MQEPIPDFTLIGKDPYLLAEQKNQTMCVNGNFSSL